ncbi:hypothetical protein [Phycicoccus flavus]|uniref:Uncharacterized protein n=1 Tax=Phycicoccus flavus TaxID=2502783 RepID=A0A8T6R692_9MICO|nr:hypothetical protein [Phycicoccus flavus]NHA68345.1 hypothetical protein [Phycicoccus flavus]
MSDEGLRQAVAASRAWYDDVFGLHGTDTGCDGALWWAEGPPPRWHSAVKTLVPTTDPAGVLARMEPHPSGSVADGFALLDLAPHGFDVLFTATWLRHDPVPAADPPPGWSRVADDALMRRWNVQHDTVGVLPDDLWAHPRFRVLVRSEGEDLLAGTVLHDAAPVLGLSNSWTADGAPPDPGELLALAAAAAPSRAVVDHAVGADLDAMLAGGFEPLGPLRVWVR